MSASLHLGLISGTSADGVDSALVRFAPSTEQAVPPLPLEGEGRGEGRSGSPIQIVGAATLPYPPELRARILALATSHAAIDLDDYGALDVAIGECFADAALSLLRKTGTRASDVAAIGSHGQTIRHRPTGAHPFTLQIGDPTVIAERTGITTIADFRRADVAAGGQGAPLLPALHAALFAGTQTRVVLNLGGIANVTVLAPGRDVVGFDTGPANCLLDAWVQRHRGSARDEGGTWATSGRVDRALLARWLSDPYFAAAPPKSTGREEFNLDWLAARGGSDAAAADVQATLLALSAETIAHAIRAIAPDAREVFACGGGVHNPALMSAIGERIAPAHLASTAALGLDPDYVEAAGFAWLARVRLANAPGNLPAVTGARGSRVLGAIHAAPHPAS
ncbi:MAG TPA: anhydro-N-acetylmuramic acid kinase [Rhodanobacteraceae bacterium]|nr:anhydro-N-acetylmuramic acid kinase [Rhodanobacteraceae bacterium]